MEVDFDLHCGKKIPDNRHEADIRKQDVSQSLQTPTVHFEIGCAAGAATSFSHTRHSNPNPHNNVPCQYMPLLAVTSTSAQIKSEQSMREEKTKISPVMLVAIHNEYVTLC